MKNNLSRLVLVGFDIIAIYVSIVISYYMVMYFGVSFEYTPVGDLVKYTDKLIVYVLVITSLFGLSIYKYRHDFWEETYLIIKSLVLSLFMVLSVLALSNTIDNYSAFVVLISFCIMAFILPIFKFILKKRFSVFGLWAKKATVISGNSDIVNEIFGNKYLGYVKSSQKNSDVVFMDTVGSTKVQIEEKLNSFMHAKKEIIFIPLLNSFNYANAGIIEIFNSRVNMIVLENALLSKRNILLKQTAEMFLSLFLVPLLIPVFGIIIFLMRKEEPKGSILFRQDRMGKNGKIFVCYKFRSMREDGDEVLTAYLQEHPQEVENYNVYHKYANDPRITKVGNFMRRTSLDELPQIINVFKGEMSLIGPRPYMLNEKKKIGSKIDMVLAVKPGISGLWQVSGRSDVDFHSRVDMDVYYTRNWNLWLDFVIFLKTIKTVFFREGAS
ncbi:sugar transferase [bacterium]|nr:sugar transferase [bacterium]MBU1993795.1 sugar transferase [bacterium]